jgi:hypothetical protein
MPWIADGSGDVFLPLDEDDAALYNVANDTAAHPQPTCPNCGATEFDEDGDCTSCWEPGVVKPAGGTGRASLIRWLKSAD